MFSPDFAGQSSRCHPMAMASRNADLLRETVGAQGFRGFRGSGFTSEILKDGVWGIVVALVSPKSQQISKLWDMYTIVYVYMVI